MAAPPNVEMEAAKFLHKLIQESKDEPTKLATKLHVILQHMRSSGKENSMPYQVISRAMETVINQHGLDIDALTSSRSPLTTGTQVVDSASSQFAGSSLRGAVAMEANTSLVSGDLTKTDPYASNRPPVGPSFTGHDIYQGSASHLNSKSLDHESPSSFDTRSVKSHSEERHDSPKWEKAKKKDNKKGGSKRKKGDPSSNSENQFGNIQPLESSTFGSGMDKAATKADQPRNISIQGGEHGQFNNMVQSSSMMEHNTMRSALRGKQEIQHQGEKSVDSTNISNSLSRTPHSRHPEEIEVSSAHNALSRQQGVSLPAANDVLNTRGTWNQTKTNTAFEKSQVPRFSFNASSGNLSAETLLNQSAGPAGKAYGMATSTSGAYSTTVPGLPGSVQFSNTYDNPSLGPKMNKDRNMEPFSSASSLDVPSDKGTFGNALEYEGGNLNTSGNDSSLVQGGMLNNVTEMGVLRSTGKLPISQSPSAPIMPFKEQHLKQLRAQCLVYLAFRNGLKPKKLHLDFALGNFFPKEEGPSKDMVDHKGKEQLFDGTSKSSDVPTPFGRQDNSRESENMRLDPSSIGLLSDVKLTKGEYMNVAGEKSGMPSGFTEYGEENRTVMMARRKPDSEVQTGELVQSQLSAMGVHPDGFGSRSSPRNNHKDDLDNRHQQVRSIDQASSVMGMGQQLQMEMTGQSGNSCDEDASNLSLQSLAALNESVPERKDNAPNQPYSLADRNFQGNRAADAYLPSFPPSAHWKPLSRTDGGNLMVSPDDSKISHKSYSASVGSIRVPADNALLNGNPFLLGDTHEEEDASMATDLPSSPKYTTTEKMIIDQQKRKLLTEKTWALKQQRTQERIAACSDKLKDNVSSSEDISAKTRSVIELKKLQLLELQRRLRKDIVNDFFRPIASDMDRLKSIKKHRIGRRSKQLEKYEQKMKEERQKRFRERQKEFFSEIEIHKERLEDVFKMRRERWKGFNRSVREFHKRKERIHREKIDRIQREKINLLKINDVEGYLRMVQDAKSDRVKQLLKETEKYLQKLGSKLRDAKALTCEMDDTRGAGVIDKNEMITDNEDETDQAKHYLESNEKYYLMAHSIKENVAEQPSCLVGGKLREYQMNGLRWLVSLYNNHLNGILADEMGLGKTVQVISLICYLMENKNDLGPFLVVVPSSVLPGWDSEINFWAPSINKIVYSGPPEERRRLLKERIVPQKFNVLLTTYEYLMNKNDRPKLSKIHWHYVIIDEGHRIKNASCKLNADLKLYHSSHRLLLTGTPLQNNLEELWALLNFLLPNIFNSSEDFSQWFNKPFESNGDSSPDEALLSEEENLLIINRLHQVLRPFVLRRLKHKVENELPEKIERLVRCEASAYQKLLMKRVEDNLGALGTSKARSVHNSVMELRNICNHPYLSQLHSEEVHDYIPKHYLPNIVRLCGKLEMLDRILPKLKATDHRVLLFSTMTRLLDVMEDYLYWKQYKYLRLDGHTCGGDRGALIDQFNKPDSPYFIFLLSIRAGGVGVNLQAADTVIIFDTDWNPQVDLQAQARAHRIGQKREVLVLRFETVQTVEEQVRAAAEHKLGVANQSITAGFFDNNTSAEDRREYLESLLRESKKEEAAPVLHDDAVNDLIARSEAEIDIFESIDKRRQEEEMAAWKVALGGSANSSELSHTLPSRLVAAEELKAFSEAMKIYDAPTSVTVSNVGGIKRKSGYLGGLDTQHYGRGKRAREVRSYEEQWTEDEFEKLCQAESPHSPKMKDEVKEMNLPMIKSEDSYVDVKAEKMVPSEQPMQPPLEQPAQPTATQLAQPSHVQSPMKTTEPRLVHLAQSLAAQSAKPHQQAAQLPVVQATYPSVSQAGQTPIMQQTQRSKETTPKRGRGRPKRVTTQISPTQTSPHVSSLSGAGNMDMGSQTGPVSNSFVEAGLDHATRSTAAGNSSGTVNQSGGIDTSQATLPSASPSSQPTLVPCPVPVPDKRRGRKGQSGVETPQRRGRKTATAGSSTNPVLSPSLGSDTSQMASQREIVSSLPAISVPAGPPVKDVDKETSSVSLIPVILPSENIMPQDVQVSSSCILPNPSVPAEASVKADELHAGTFNPEQNVPCCPLPPNSQAASVATDISSQQDPRLSSVTSAPQSVSPSQVVPKQVKGRGNKGQSESETTRRRGRKPSTASTAVPGGSGGHEQTSNEPPQKKSRISSGKTAIASRRKQQNETQNLVNVVLAEASEVHATDSVDAPGLSGVTGGPYQSVENNQAASSVALEVAVRCPSKESGDVKVSQLDVPISGDDTLLTKMDASQSSMEPVGIDSCKAPITNVAPTIEVTSDTQSSELQSSRSESVQLTQPTFQALETAPVSDLRINEESGAKVEEITNASLGATQGDTSNIISETQNLESKIVSAVSNMETCIATLDSGDTSNLASSTLETNQTSDAAKVGSPVEKECCGKLEEVPGVDTSESPKINSYVQDIAETDKFTQESLEGKDAIHHVSEKCGDAEDCMVHSTREAVRSVEDNVRVDDAVVENRESINSYLVSTTTDDAMAETKETINSYQVSAPLDGRGHDSVASSGADRNFEIIADAVNDAVGDTECSAGLVMEKFILAEDVRMSDPCGLTVCAGEEPERIEAVVAPEYNTETYAAKEKQEAEVQSDVKDLSEPKGDKVAQADEEATLEIGQSLVEPSVQQCQTQMEKEFEASEKVELSGEQLQTRAGEDLNSRRKQQSETQNLVNAVQAEDSEVHKFDNVVGPGLSDVTGGPNQCIGNNQAASSVALEVAVSSPSEESADVKVSQLDVPFSGDDKLLTEMKASQSSVQPVGLKLCESPIKIVAPAIEVTSDAKSSEYQASSSKSIHLTQPTFQALETTPLANVESFDMQTREESSGKVKDITNASLEAPEGDTSTDISVIQTLESGKVSALCDMETSIATEGSNDTSNLASSNFETDQTSDAAKVGSPVEKICAGKLEEVPEVDVFVQDIADTNKSTEESLRSKDEIQHVSEKSVDTKDCLVHITKEAVSYVEGNIRADDAVVETRELINIDQVNATRDNATVESKDSRNSCQVSAALDGRGDDLVGSSAPDKNIETIAGAINVVVGNADCSAGLVTEKFILAMDVEMSDPCLTGCAGEEERTDEPVVAPEYNTEINAGKEKQEAEIQSEAKDLSEPKNEQFDKEAQGDVVDTVEIGQSFEEPFVQQCQTQMEKEFEASETVEISGEQLQTQAGENLNSRRQQQNETQNLVNSVQAEASEVHIADNVAGPGLSDVTVGPYQSVGNNQAASSLALEVASRSPSKESADVKVSQLDVQFSGDDKLLTKIKASHSSVEPVGMELCKSPAKNVALTIEVTSETRSLEYHSSESESVQLTQPTFQALETSPPDGIFDLQNEEIGGKVMLITNASLEATQGEMLAEISENQNLESVKVSAVCNMESSIAAQGSGDASNLASSTWETGKTSDAAIVESPFENKCGGMLEEVPEVNIAESLKIDVFVQDITETNKFTEESLIGEPHRSPEEEGALKGCTEDTKKDELVHELEVSRVDRSESPKIDAFVQEVGDASKTTEESLVGEPHRSPEEEGALKGCTEDTKKDELVHELEVSRVDRSESLKIDAFVQEVGDTSKTTEESLGSEPNRSPEVTMKDEPMQEMGSKVQSSTEGGEGREDSSV
ncbi:chromatin structure-remodeling complex protein SYD isoform X2 [Daucus carota subsp. sativus]|uniref:chromatin structure-remodeling complex protein SYD isoform X2 n=1 Tax=Daucus carota subsp. sativus TaxID=79200 RepID=UPI003082DE40